MMISFKKKTAAFTMIEAITTMAILAILAVVLVPVLREGLDSWLFIRSRQDSFPEGSLALSRMMQEFKRDAITILPGSGVSDGTNFSFLNATGTTRYYYDSGCVKRQLNGIPAAGRILVRNVTNPQGSPLPPAPFTSLFLYFDRNGTPIAPPLDQTEINNSLRQVGIYFIISDASGRPIRFASRVWLRNKQ
ncbi:MAG: type II secretion system protein [Candidatus Omnitrophota bacterium]